jgi:hypothetical protein
LGHHKRQEAIVCCKQKIKISVSFDFWENFLDNIK